MTRPHASQAAVVAEWQDTFDAMLSRWQPLVTAAHLGGRRRVSAWEVRRRAMSAAHGELVRASRWRGGPRTLLGALGVHDLELKMTAGLAWLLRADGHHGLGDALLSGLASRLGIDVLAGHQRTRVVAEEQREQTRADLVVYGPGWTIVVEAKTYAIEQPEQLDRLHHHWRDEAEPRFVFLTRRQRLPTTAMSSADLWHRLTWSDIAALGRTAADGRSHVAPGVHEYLATLEAYHRV